jgi:sulfite reductase (ferredoxin)
VTGTPPPIVRTLDLRGVACPLNYVKTRVALERLSAGEALEVWLDTGEPAENVPRSCDEDGYTVLALGEAEEAGEAPFVRLIVTAGI